MAKIRVPATTANLGPGFDCLGLSLSLYNTVEIVASDSWGLEISGEGSATLSQGTDNLVWRAACHLWDRVGVTYPVVRIRMHNQIPLGRGLGSSAAAIVGGLLAANKFLPHPLDAEQLIMMGTELEGHPDNVAPAILGGLVTSVMSRSGVTSVSLPLRARLQYLVCIPHFELPTSLARKALPPSVSHLDAAANLSRLSLLMAALTLDRPDLLPIACEDRLHQPHRWPLIPGAQAVGSAACEAGALTVVISGAGPTLLALLAAGTDPHPVGEAMLRSFGQHGIEAHWLVLEPDLRGAMDVT